jgi:hypothetical protein
MWMAEDMKCKSRRMRGRAMRLSIGWKLKKMSGAVAVVETAPPNVGRSANR